MSTERTDSTAAEQHDDDHSAGAAADAAGTATVAAEHRDDLPMTMRPTVRPVLVWMAVTVLVAGGVVAAILGNAQALGETLADVLVQVVAVVALLVVLRLGIRMFVLTRTEYRIDGTRVRRRYSLFLRTWDREVPVSMVRSSELRQSRVQKLLGYGTIEVNRGLGDVSLDNVANPQDVRRTLTELVTAQSRSDV